MIFLEMISIIQTDHWPVWIADKVFNGSVGSQTGAGLFEAHTPI